MAQGKETMRGVPPWISLSVPPKELRLSTTLSAGQSFSWIPTGPKEWSGVIGGHLLCLRQLRGQIVFCSPLESLSESEGRALLADYFQLHISLDALYADWAARDPNNFAKRAVSFPGLRILRWGFHSYP